MPADMPPKISPFPQVCSTTFQNSSPLPTKFSEQVVKWTQNEETQNYVVLKLEIVAFPQTCVGTSRQFIKLDETFNHKIDDFIVDGVLSYTTLHDMMKLSTEAILNFSPNHVSLEVTNEGSLFYTVIKNGLTIYFEHYICNLDEDLDEVIFTSFKGGINIYNYSGKLFDSINKMKDLFHPQTTYTGETTYNGLPN